MAGPRVLGTRELNRALLARQGLLDRYRLPVPRTLERIGGIQAQYAPAMYVGLWSRVQGLARTDVTTALERRTAVQATLMRVTIHLVSAADYWPVALGVRASRRALWLRAMRRGQPAEALEAAAVDLRAALAHGPMRRAEVEAVVGRDLVAGVGLWLDLVRVPPSGTWERRRADLYGLAEDWLGPPPADASPAAGVDLLVRRYLQGFGPATPPQVADWAGLPLQDVREALGRLPVRELVTDDGVALVDLPRQPLPPGDAPAPVRFLPQWDATLLAHARRTQVLPEEHRPLVFSTKTPQSVGTFLVDGAVAGTWKADGDRIRTMPFAPLPVRAQRELDAEAEQLAAFHAAPA